MKIYTKTGDAGETALFGGQRVPKQDLRIEAYGDVDELNAVIGLALSLDPADFHRETLHRIQTDLFSLGAILASPEPDRVKKALEKAVIDDRSVAFLEQSIDAAESQLEPLTAFIVPGGSSKAAALHVARTVCRRAERHVLKLTETAGLPAVVIPYLNRLSDLLFVLARLANRDAGVEEAQW